MTEHVPRARGARGKGLRSRAARAVKQEPRDYSAPPSYTHTNPHRPTTTEETPR